MTLTISKKLIISALMNILILAGLLVFVFTNLQKLATLQNDGIELENLSVKITAAVATGASMYAIVADAEINHELEQTEKDWDVIKKESDSELKEIGAEADTPEEKAAIEKVELGHDNFIKIFEQKMLPALKESKELTQEIRDMDGQIDKARDEMTKGLEAMKAIQLKVAEDSDKEYDSTATEMKSVTSIVAVCAGLLSLGMSIWLMVGINRPVKSIIDAMKKLASGDIAAEIPFGEKKDEIGDIARAVVGIRESVAEKARRDAAIAEEQRRKEEETKRSAEEQRRLEAERLEEAAAAERKKAMMDMADRFESSVGSVVDTVSSAATELRSSAESMTQISQQTTDRASAVAAATEEATASVQTVANASEQLLSAINEISQKVEESAGFTRQAVSRAQATNTTVEGLAESAKKIDNVVKMIQDIAWQTNLLALNATIEAARAGDAGKGFAVVAAEVKNLADQTSKATVEISEQISNMQTNTQDAVKAIRDISTQVAQINQISESIAAAVEEQSASTKEITQNVQQASVGTQEVAKNIVEVSRASGESGAAASEVLGASSELSVKSEQLRTIVESFIAQVRGS